jgi:hypothetical protein
MALGGQRDSSISEARPIANPHLVSESRRAA